MSPSGHKISQFATYASCGGYSGIIEKCLELDNCFKGIESRACSICDVHVSLLLNLKPRYFLVFFWIGDCLHFRWCFKCPAVVPLLERRQMSSDGCCTIVARRPSEYQRRRRSWLWEKSECPAWSCWKYKTMLTFEGLPHMLGSICMTFPLIIPNNVSDTKFK